MTYPGQERLSSNRGWFRMDESSILSWDISSIEIGWVLPLAHEMNIQGDLDGRNVTDLRK